MSVKRIRNLVHEKVMTEMRTNEHWLRTEREKTDKVRGKT